MSAEPPLVAAPHRSDLVCLGVLAAIMGAAGFAVTARMLAAGLGSDYGFHVQLAETIANTGRISTPEFLYHLTTIAVHAAWAGVSYATAGTLAAVAYFMLLSTIVYAVIRPAFGQAPSTSSAGLALALALSLMLVSPVSLPTWPQHNLYLGYIGINVYHNPTIVALKPFALLLSLAAVRFFAEPRPRGMLEVIGAGVLVVIATLAKPNYTLCLLPALALLAAYRLWRHQPINWPLGLGIVGPALAVLAWQYSLTYTSGQPIEFAPFAVFLYFTSGLSLVPKLLLSVLFPLAVYGLYFRQARRALYLNLCWCVFLVSLAFNYLLAESGERYFHANFTWGAQAALFILFVAAARFWIVQLREPGRPDLPRRSERRAFVAAGLFGLHLVSGLLWYYSQLAFGQTGWW